jgi:hypothetical protein
MSIENVVSTQTLKKQLGPPNLNKKAKIHPPHQKHRHLRHPPPLPPIHPPKPFTNQLILQSSNATQRQYQQC